MTVTVHHECCLKAGKKCKMNETCFTERCEDIADEDEEEMECCNDELMFTAKEAKVLDDLKNNNEKYNEEDDEKYKKMRKLLTFEEAPNYLAHNKFILTGYRTVLTTKLCLESIFWWTNETINIWSHIFGFTLFSMLTIYDYMTLNIHAHLSDKIIVFNVMFCFIACMFLSAMYHTFSCRSEKDFHCFLTYDLFGIALSLLAIYTSGIYFAFWCHQGWQQFYIVTVTLIFMGAMLVQLPKFDVDSNVKMMIFVGWAAYGVIPTIHWTFVMGGLKHPVVQLLLPRVLGMYAISGVAFLIYLTKIPERFYAGRFDYLGHSHQWWHFLVVAALYFWHNSGVLYINYRVNHACTDTMRLD